MSGKVTRTLNPTTAGLQMGLHLPVQCSAEDLRTVVAAPGCISPAGESLPQQACCSAALYLHCSMFQTPVFCHSKTPLVDSAPLDVVDLSAPLRLQYLFALPVQTQSRYLCCCLQNLLTDSWCDADAS